MWRVDWQPKNTPGNCCHESRRTQTWYKIFLLPQKADVLHEKLKYRPNWQLTSVQYLTTNRDGVLEAMAYTSKCLQGMTLFMANALTQSVNTMLALVLILVLVWPYSSCSCLCRWLAALRNCLCFLMLSWDEKCTVNNVYSRYLVLRSK